jgi:xanthine/CO dehydrogenase XdhC/CoxF family maturation factor
MLGPKDRSQKIWAELEAEGLIISTTDADRIYAPMGLDIGAVTPEEIALSLLAEVRAVFSGRAGGYLRLRSASIHERS